MFFFVDIATAEKLELHTKLVILYDQAIVKLGANGTQVQHATTNCPPQPPPCNCEPCDACQPCKCPYCSPCPSSDSQDDILQDSSQQQMYNSICEMRNRELKKKNKDVSKKLVRCKTILRNRKYDLELD